MVRQHSSSWAGPSDRTAIAGSALRSRERSTGQVQEAADIDQGRVPADADVVGDLGGGLVEVAQLGRQVGQPLVVREVGVRSGVRTAGEGARRWGREGGVEVVSELPGALVAAVVAAVAGDVALPEAVAAQQVIHAGGYAIAVLAIAGEEMATTRTTRLLRMRPLEPQSQPSPGAYGWPHGCTACSARSRSAASTTPSRTPSWSGRGAP